MKSRSSLTVPSIRNIGTSCHGFLPRSARETEAHAASKYSIHGLSRSTGEGGESLARFNLPLNLGWPPHFALSEKDQLGRIDGSPLFPKVTRIEDSSPIWLGSIRPDTTPRCFPSFAKFLLGSERWTMSSILRHRRRAFFRAFRIFVLTASRGA